MSLKEPGPADRLRELGLKAASPVDLIAVGFSRSEEDTRLGEEAARRLLMKYGNIRGFREVDAAHLSEATGLDDFELLRAGALMEIGRRAALAGKGEQREINGPEDAIEVIVERLQHLKDEKQEHFFAILLDSKNQILAVERIHIGTLTMSIVGPREVFRAAIRGGASCVVVAHNHPSGDPTPSAEDINVTRRLSEIGKMLDIPVYDHLVIGDPDYVSLRQRGLMG